MAARKTPLRAVKPDEKPPAPPKPKTIEQAAESGTHKELLEALRTRVAKTVADPNCPPRDLAALSRRLQELAKEIAALDAAEEQEGGRSGEVPDEALDASAF